MSNEFHDDWIPGNTDPLNSPDQDFDWEGLFQALQENAERSHDYFKVSQAFAWLIQALIPQNNKQRLCTRNLGLRLIALLWVLNPAYFEDSPSVRELAKRIGIRSATLANYTGHYSRLLGWRNRAQSHAWNWSKQKVPRQRGKVRRTRRKRNVPPIGIEANSKTKAKRDKKE